MSITTYSELKTAVANWLHRDDLTSIIPDLVTLGETRIYRDLRIRCMETALSSAISSGVVALPTGYLELKHAYIDANPVRKLERKTAQWIYQNYPTRAADGEPRYIARDAGNFIFGPYPDTAYTVKGTYYKRLDALSDSNPTNWFTANSPDILLFSALCEAAPYIKNDSRIAVWEQKYADSVQRLTNEDRNEEFSGSMLAMSGGR